jgi:hypothetical protein
MIEHSVSEFSHGKLCLSSEIKEAPGVLKSISGKSFEPLGSEECQENQKLLQAWRSNEFILQGEEHFGDFVTIARSD